MFQRLSGGSRRRIDEENPYWISFADLMSGLLVIFILASVAFNIQLKESQRAVERKRSDVERAIEELTVANERRADLLDDIKAKLEARGILVEVSDNKTVLRISDDYLFFESLSFQIPPDRQKLVAAIGEVLYAALVQNVKNKRHQFLDTIFIEGHTDSKPATMLEFGNWGLSAYRAIQVWRFWTRDQTGLKNLAELENFDGRRLFSVSGYAATRPLEHPDDTPEKRRRNRRIDLRFTVRQPTIGQYRGVLRDFDQ